MVILPSADEQEENALAFILSTKQDILERQKNACDTKAKKAVGGKLVHKGTPPTPPFSLSCMGQGP